MGYRRLNYLTNYLLSAEETSTAIARLQRAFLVYQFGAPTMRLLPLAGFTKRAYSGIGHILYTPQLKSAL